MAPKHENQQFIQRRSLNALHSRYIAIYLPPNNSRRTQKTHSLGRGTVVLRELLVWHTLLTSNVSCCIQYHVNLCCDTCINVSLWYYTGGGIYLKNWKLAADGLAIQGARALSQCPGGRLSVGSREVSGPRDLHLELSDRSWIWQALRQQCCRCACRASKRYDNLGCQSRGFEALRDLARGRLFGYWDGVQSVSRQVTDAFSPLIYYHPHKNDVRVTFESVLFCPQTTTRMLSQVAASKANLPIV